MASRVNCQVENESPVTIVRLSGSLDMTTTGRVHAALQRCLAAQPDALVVDLTPLMVEEPLALAVFAAVARQAAHWPDVPVVLCAPGGETARRLAQSAVCRLVPVRHSCAEAVRDARRRGTSSRLRTRLEPVADACRRARELAADACERWRLPDLAGPASVVLSELVANVVRHAHTPMDVTLTLRRPYLHIAVRDGSADAPRPAAVRPDTEGGRGLLLIRELAHRWGSLPTGDGKVVWAMLALP
jgi:anti-anti-sigma regulatory factor